MERPKDAAESGARETKRAVLFIRVNRAAVGDRSAVQASLELQRRRGEEVARQFGAHIVREHLDDASGVSLDRPDIEATLMIHQLVVDGRKIDAGIVRLPEADDAPGRSPRRAEV